jgi:hypothetical protein
MKHRLPFAVSLLILMLDAALAQSQQLAIQTEVGKQTLLQRTDLEALPHVKVTAGDSTFEGVALRTVLEKAGVDLANLKGKRLASCLLVEAADGYRVVFALPELDPAFADKQVLLAFLRDGKPLDEKEGPYRILVPDEKKMARWVRQVTKLRIVEIQ